MTDALYTVCRNAQLNDHSTEHKINGAAYDAHSRWQILLDKKDPKLIWFSINWNGKIVSSHSVKDAPDDYIFRRHFEELLNPISGETELRVPPSNMYIPILDDPITLKEVNDAIARLHRDKVAGVDGIPPGLLTLLKGEWLNIMTFLFNMVLMVYFPNSGRLPRYLPFSRKATSRIQTTIEA